MGSVKDLEVLKEPTATELGIGRFHFSDRYSVFDWGEMPDTIKDKGAALCIMGAYCFERLEKLGIRTHYRGLIGPEGKLLRTDELTEPVNTMEIDLVRVIPPHYNNGYDYSIYSQTIGNFLVPLEIIYRNGLPEGSSVFRRLAEGLKPEALGLSHYPQPGEELEQPIFDVSTKLERTDRYISWGEAQKLACLTDDEVAEMRNKLSRINNEITIIANRASLKNVDGKVEFGYDPNRQLMVVDVLGTLDECRFTYEGLHVSKEVARQFYRSTPWYNAVVHAKREAEEKRIEDWKSLCKLSPPKLDTKLREIITCMYTAVTNRCTGINLFDAPRLSEVMKEFKAYLETIKESV
jgi:phosphoribosylaminoimidazole-succinocarboxamide synthase